jgi:opacity protein-like surface antigen
MKKILFAVFLVLVFSVLLSADIYIKSNIHTDAFTMMGKNQPAKDEITEQWIGNNQMANITGDKVMIMDMNRNLMYIVNPKEKSYVETTLPLDMSKLIPKEMAPMMGMMKLTVKVTPNGQTQKINKWNCSGYDVDMGMSMMQMKMKVWATTDVPFDWKAFAKMYANISKMSFMDDAAIAEFMKITGHQVASEMTMNMMGANMKVSTQVMEITSKPAPAGIYTVPANFSKKENLSLQDLRGGQ